DELVLDVAVVDVEGGCPRLRAADHRLQVLVAVVEVETDVVLSRLPRGELGALPKAAEPRRGEHAREAPAAAREVSPRKTARRGDDRIALRNGRGDALVEVGEREGHG